MTKAKRTCNISDDLLHKKPENMLLTRWLTTTNRINRLYVAVHATAQPSSDLYMLTQFIVNSC